MSITKKYPQTLFCVYEYFTSSIITSNQPLSKWGEVFGDPVLANAIIDRLVHHSSIIKITGKSYRVKDKLIDFDDVSKKIEAPNP